MTQEELKQFLEENANDESIQEVVKQYAPKPKLEDLLADEEYSKKFNSLLDSEKSKAVESYKENTLPKRVEERVKEELQKKEKKDPWQLKLEEMEKKQQDLMNQLTEKEKAEQREKLRNKAFKVATEKNLPTDVIDYFIGEDEDSTFENLGVLESTLSNYGENIKKDIYKNKNTGVQDKTDNKSDPNRPGENATKEEWLEYYKNK